MTNPVPATLPSVYKPASVEAKWYPIWLEKKCFHGAVQPGKEPFSIVIPPPNVTGSLHMGHALNNTIQDILIRWRKMQGFATCWFPGTDHAGIATQMVVERELRKKEGLSRHDLGREKFVEEVWKWKKEYGGIIDGQLQKLGASCDWDRYAFTMDEKRAKAVREAFVHLYKKGYIYRDRYIVNWCPRCLTALSDLEVVRRENPEPGKLYHLRYPVLDGKEKFIVIATTRPETILADVAVAVHPEDARYKSLIGKEAVLPLVGRKLKIIADAWADPNVGTGAVKITPAHDPNDFEVGRRHHLDPIVVIDPDGKMNMKALSHEQEIEGPTKTELVQRYHGLDRFECREKILEALRERGFLVKEEDWPSNPGHCDRCGTIIEPYLSVQWFMRMDDLAKPAIAVVKEEKIKFHPERFTKLYLDWMENIRDWCLSRQLWWGHQIPAWYCLKCAEPAIKSLLEKLVGPPQTSMPGDPLPSIDWTGEDQIREFTKKAKPMVSVEKPNACPTCGSQNLVQDPDVLDTWFSSALWPLSTMGWPDETKDLQYFYPTRVLSTGRDILYLWVARMIMMGLEFRQTVPFHDVYIHATILDKEGKRMSKSKGTGIDPLLLIEKYGADATRFGIIRMAQGQDVRYNEEKIEEARNFANKIWNAARFVQMHASPPPRDLSLHDFFSAKIHLVRFYDHWILSQTKNLLVKVNENLEHYDFAEAANALYDFFWDNFCDWYLELCKMDLQGQGDNPERKGLVLGILYAVLKIFLRLLHPFMPYLTEEIAQSLLGGERLLLESPWPSTPLFEDETEKESAYPEHQKEMARLMETAKGIRNLRAEVNLKLTETAEIQIQTSNPAAYKKIKTALEFLTHSQISIFPPDEGPTRQALSFPLRDGMLFLPFKNEADFQTEILRKQKEREEAIAELARIRKVLENPAFTEKAKHDVVEREREKEKRLVEKLHRIEERIKLLTG